MTTDLERAARALVDEVLPLLPPRVPPLHPKALPAVLHRHIDALTEALRAALAAPAEDGAVVAWGDINALLRHHVEGIKDRGCDHYGEPFSCDKQPNGTRSLRPCEPCLMARLLDRASFDSIFGKRAHPPAPATVGDALALERVARDAVRYALGRLDVRDAERTIERAAIVHALAAHRAGRPA